MRRSAALVRLGTLAALAGTAHAALNAHLLRVPPPDPPQTVERVSVLLPLRDEAARVEPCLRALLAQRGVADLEVLVLDDESQDGTAEVVRRVAGCDARVRVLDGSAPPPGWLGKPHACWLLGRAAIGSVLVFVDADVVLEPDAVAATVALLRSAALDLVSPYPRQLAGSAAERLVQPMLQWSWLTTLPLRLAERSPHPALAAANGQLLAVDAAAYRRAGGHATVRADVLEDIALLRAVKRAGGHGTVADGTAIATCRMYDGWPALRDGYTKSLWAAFGSRRAAAGVAGLLGVAYVVPPVAMLCGSRTGALGYAAAVLGRVVTARATGGRVWPDALAHPVSVLTVVALTAQSWRRAGRVELSWKGRPVVAPPGPIDHA